MHLIAYILYICYIFMKILDTRTRLKSHHGAAVTSRVAGATKNSSHITTLKSHHGHHFLKEFIAGANESSKSYHHVYLDQNQEILASAQSICNFWKKCVHHSQPFTLGRWFWQVGSLCINHSHLHWGADLDRLVVYASIMAIYIGALVLIGW